MQEERQNNKTEWLFWACCRCRNSICSCVSSSVTWVCVFLRQLL